MRHSWRLVAGLCVSFFLFSYPLFNLYRVTFPWTVVKEHSYDHDIMGWNPGHETTFTYKGKPSTTLMQFKDRHIANVRVALGDAAPHTGFAMLHTAIAQGAPADAADNRFLSGKFGGVALPDWIKSPLKCEG
ncbi:hypothetical protein DSLASN_36460 [Desulfoluna limicola]|uniref:Uncharacterized protein n=1 Tax=Desulfoluna limicola TaxID=2810562 RepID=A0ABM7PLL7_9BACT|nr:hypothetical protein [Desulfoluna limicola]BCS98014.1 hypothetical protein DSLASN_36460 [Desulfoluna limicola]